MPETLPVHNGNNHWRHLLFKDNGVGSQSSLISPILSPDGPVLNECWWPPALVPSHQVPPHPIPPRQDMAVGGGRGGGGRTQKALLHLITRDSPRQHDKNKRNTYSCVVFLSTTSYTGGGHISRTVAKEPSPVCDISPQSQCRGCRRGEGAGETSPDGPIMRRAGTPVL